MTEIDTSFLSDLRRECILSNRMRSVAHLCHQFEMRPDTVRKVLRDAGYTPVEYEPEPELPKWEPPAVRVFPKGEKCMPKTERNFKIHADFYRRHRQIKDIALDNGISTARVQQIIAKTQAQWWRLITLQRRRIRELERYIEAYENPFYHVQNADDPPIVRRKVYEWN